MAAQLQYESAPASIAATAPVCLHVGYHKCASTTLQKNLFANHPQMQPMRKVAGFEDADRAVDLIIEQLVAGKSGDDVPPEARLLWQRAEAKARASGRLPVFSWERLTRHFYFRTPSDDRVPRMLKAVVGEARIVVVVRHQIRLLESLYLSRIKPPRYLTPEEWFAGEGKRSVNAYWYANVIETYQSVFGRENVLVLAFEELASDPERFARKLCEHAGVDPDLAAGLLTRPARNSRPSQTVQTYSRLRNKLLPGISVGRFLPAGFRRQAYRILSRGKRSQAVFTPEIVSALEDIYRPQNRRLMEAGGVDLQRFGYPL